MRLVEVLIFVGFYDIGDDIGVWVVKVSEMLDFAGFGWNFGQWFLFFEIIYFIVGV